jgi:nitric oxide reductase NorD protein
VAVLVDVSRSTESYVGEKSVIDVEREALVALAEGLQACGDEAAILTFSSLRRDRVFVSRIKDFDEHAGAVVRRRIAALKPGFYTRLGAAIRHTSLLLAGRASKKRLLLVLTDGKPNDLDHYEGRYGIEDTRRAVQEARRAGHAVFAITVDTKAQSYVPHIFGAGGFAILSHPARLTAALPVLYRHLVS